MPLQITYRTKINGSWDAWRNWFFLSIPFSAGSTNPNATAIEYKARDTALTVPYSLGIQDVLYNGGSKFIIIIPTNTSEYSSGEIPATFGNGRTYYTNESSSACDGDDDCPDGYVS